MSAAALIVNVLIAYSALQAIFIAVVLLRTNQKSLFRFLFSTLLVIEGITLLERLLVETDLIGHVPHLLGISYPISFVKAPLLLLMAFAITDKAFSLRRKTLLHLIPFGLMFALNIPFYFMSGSEKVESVLEFMNVVPSFDSFAFYFSLSFFAYIGIYLVLAIRRLGQFRAEVSNNSLVNWYRVVLICYSGFLLLHLAYYLLQPIMGLNFALINQVSMVSMALIIQSIAFKLIDRSALLNAKIPDLTDLRKRDEHANLIASRFESDKIFVDDTLNLQALASSVDLSPAYVSEIINQKFGCSFKKLVSKYRVQEAKKLIATASADVKLIDIAYDVGFNNKVSFYRAFKDIEDVSPSAYLESVRFQKG